MAALGLNAMTTRETWAPADVVAKIAVDFPHEPAATVLALLEEYKGAAKLRVTRCILHLAKGGTDQLLQLIGSANTDYRDVIYWAEYDRSDQRIHDFNLPFAVAAKVPRDDSLSYMGGRPYLQIDAEIPTCAICSARMCFFFQVALPAGHRWQHAILSMFSCISCCSEDTLIPEMLTIPLKGAEIPQGFLARYQTNFRIVVGDVATASYRSDYDPLIEYSPINASTWCIGDQPQWLLDDEAPGSYESFKESIFLFQVPSGMIFPMRSGAPAQKTLDLKGQVVDAEERNYELFLGNAIYFFGFGSPASEQTYVVTQVD
jgi:hypothetical protein